jgi:molybdopterin-guanine dinucleotide biosynthesis protein A
MYKVLSGIILSGGKSKRMVVNKSLLKINGKTFIERLTSLMTGIFEKVILIANEPELYRFLGLDTFKDIYPDIGPLGGIHSGLIHCPTYRAFVISCDMPFMTEEMIKFIADYQCNAKIVVPQADGFIQQLCGVYDKANIGDIEDILKSDEYEELRANEQSKRKCKVLSLIEKTGTEIIDIEREYPNYKGNEFFNMNTSEDYNNVISEFRHLMT